ncbi:MAG: ABC transporter ATP-binding protein, partial [Hyphomicrobiaceae bacterium]|nr:ABC transporter ATP-binding protein [Hyphomicrobiaceae bacterium]
MPLLEIQNLTVEFQTRSGRFRAVDRVSLTVDTGEIVSIVGESGSGKSVSMLAVMGLLPRTAHVSADRLTFGGRDMLTMSAKARRAIVGKDMAMIFQEPMSSLNPCFTVGFQIGEVLATHLGLDRAARKARSIELLSAVGIPDPERRLSAFPHQLSGGMSQRVMIAMAIACEPKLLIADEPTTALDVTIQRQIMELLAGLKATRRMSMLFISHDLGVVGEIADRVVVMREGQVREQGEVADIFERPRDAYTKALLACRPTLAQRSARLMVIDEHIAGAAAAAAGKPKDPQAPVVIEARALTKSFWLRRGVFGRSEFRAVGRSGAGVSFSLRRGHTLGVVGESGSGKTTMGLTLLRLHEPNGGPAGGQVLFDGRDLLALDRKAWLPMRRRIQIVFQNPYASLNPRFAIGQTLVEPMAIHGIGSSNAEREARARAILERVGLDAASAFVKYPHEFSGGQRQRIAIARCLTLEPQVLVL